MFSSVRRPSGRLFLFPSILLAAVVWAQSPPLTTVQDTVFRADGSPAQGTLLISWPAFTTADGQAVAVGSTSVILRADGGLSVGLVSNENAVPVNTVYSVIYHLNDGSQKTEFWIVPASSPVTLAQVRTTLGTTGAASQMVTQQYVNSALAGKANDTAVVHTSGDETIAGTKQFSSPPTLPAPVQPGDGVNKEYVDNAVQNNGSGSYLSTSGGTMTGALLLAGDPISPSQAADKHYADMLAAVKADLIGGLVPPTELGTGTPGPGTCLQGNQTWALCGSGGGSISFVNNAQVANPNFNSASPPAQNGFLNCSFQNAGSNVSLECPYGTSATAFALGSQAVLNNQANTYTSGVQDFSAASLRLPSGTGYAPASSGAIGYDTTANMPVINVNGTTQQLALTTSNISGQASTALSLAATPSQCNGAFATGIQANGNANCGVADVLELAETSQPTGLPNYGIFWFDSATHTPRIIQNNGQVTQLSLMNVFNSDANTLQEYNGTNPQEFDVYGTRSDPSNYERLRLGYGQFGGSGYFFIGPDYGGSGQQRGLAFFTATSPKWVIDGSSIFKPWANNAYDIGSPTLQVRNLYLGTGLIFGSGTLTGAHGTTNIAAEAGSLGTTAGAELCNDGSGNVTDVGCSGGGGMPSAPAMGQKAVWDGSSWVAKNDWKLDTTVFPGADAGTRGANCLSYLANNNFYGGGVCSMENEPAPDWLMDPFEGSTYYGPKNTPEKSVIVIPLGVPTRTEVPVAIANGTTFANTIEGMAELAGPTVGAGGNQNQNGGAELMAGTNFPPAGSSYSKIQGGTTLPGSVQAYVDDGYNSGTYCGISMSSSSKTGMVAVVGTNDFTSLLVKHEWMVIPATHVSTGQVIGHIEYVGRIDGQYCAILTRQQASAPHGGLAAGQTYAVVAPVISMGVEGLAGGTFSPDHVNQASSVHDMTISGSGIPGSITLANFADPEINFAYNLHLDRYNGAGALYEGASTQTSRFHDWMTTPDSNTCQSYTVDILLNGAAPQGGDGFVLANGQGCTNGTTQSIGIVLNATNVKLGNIHTEQKTPALAINYAATCSGGYPCLPLFYVSPLQTSHDDVVDRMDSNCAIGGGCSDGVLIGNGYAAPYKIDLRDMTIPSANTFTNNLRDLNNGNIFTPGNTPSFDYKLDSSGYPIVVANCSEMTKGSCMNNGAMANYAGGSVVTSVSATGVSGAAVIDTGLVSKAIVGTNSSGQLVDASSATLSNNTMGTAANLSGMPALPNGTSAITQSAGDNSTKLATTAYVKNELQLTWNCSLGGGTGTGTNYCQWTLPVAVTVTQLDMATAGAVGCSTWPTFQLWDATANAEVGSYSVTFNTPDFYNVIGNSSVVSGHILRMKVTTGASGCSTNPSAIVATVTYQMQN